MAITTVQNSTAGSPDSVLPLKAGTVRPAAAISSAHWTSLSYFNIYRIALALLFLLSTTGYGKALNFGGDHPRLFLSVAVVYLATAIVFQILLVWRGNFRAHLSAHVVADVCAITLLQHASGGHESGLALMLVISLAGAAVVGQGRMILFYASLATIAILSEHLAQVLSGRAAAATFVHPGLVSAAYFATAVITNRLAQRVLANEAVARERGVRLANQYRVNELIIRDAQDGIMVVDPAGVIQQCNPEAQALLGTQGRGLRLDQQSPVLAQALRRWREGTAGARQQIEFPESGRRARIRFVDAGVPGGGAIIYLEDESKLEERARQLKLAALGRLTANIAHEIRNPLSAIVHAADLLNEENRAPQRARLTRIIRDNAARLERMVQDVLELNRRDRAQSERFNLCAYVRIFIEDWVEQGGAPADGVRYEGPADVEVEFDRVHFHQVLWNLVRNAWRHSKQQPGSVVLQATAGDEGVELHVLDDGGGVPKSLLPQLFEPFFTTYSSGTGLGLYIARELCVANGARLEYRERANGADFCIVWPHTPQ